MSNSALATLSLCFLGLAPALAAAQDPTTAFDQLNTRLKPGDTVYVTDVQGREIVGRIRDLSPTSLLLDTGQPRILGPGDVQLVQTRPRDSLGNGALTGFIVGAAAAEGINLYAGHLGDCPVGCHLMIALMGGAAGVGVGALADALTLGPKLTVYRSPGASARVSVAPVVTPRHKAVAVSFTF